MLFGLIRADENAGAGMKLNASANMVGIEIAWLVAALNRTISPCEAQLVLYLVALLSLPAACALSNLETIIGEGLGILFLGISLSVTPGFMFWFWIRLYKELPLLNTKNLIWNFAEVAITEGWVRILNLTFIGFAFLASLMTLIIGMIYLRIAWIAWRCGEKAGIDAATNVFGIKTGRQEEKTGVLPDPNGNDQSPQQEGNKNTPRTSDRRQNLTRRWKKTMRFVAGVCFLEWMVTMLLVEKTITINHLMPQNDLSAPGQTIPLTIGVVTLLDGLATLLRKHDKRNGTKVG